MLVQRIAEEFSVELDLRSVIADLTLAGMSQHVAAALDALAAVDDREWDELPLSFGQERLWVVDKLVPGSSAYHLSEAFELRGPLDEAGFRRCIEYVVSRHPMLNSRIATQPDGSAAQHIGKPLPLSFRTHNLDTSALDGGVSAVRVLRRQELSRPFDLERENPIRFVLARAGQGSAYLIVTASHVMVDGPSLELVLQEIAAAYGASLTGEAFGPPDEAGSYANFVREQRSRSREGLAHGLEYWTDLLTGVEAAELPFDRSRPAQPSFGGAAAKFVIEHELSEELAGTAARLGTSLYMMLLASYLVVLARYLGPSNLVVGSPISLRGREYQRVVGFFTNTLVLPFDLADDPTFEELTSRVRQVVLESMAHAETPYEHIVASLNPRRDLAKNPLYQMVFSLDRSRAPQLAMADVEAVRLEDEVVSSHVDLECFMTLEQLKSNQSRIRGALVFDTALFEAATIDRMAKRFVRVLGQVVRDPTSRLSEFMLIDGEEAAFLQSISRGPENPHSAETVVDLFDAVARLQADAVAVEMRGERVTYGELQMQSLVVATRLREIGVAREDTVAIAVPAVPKTIALILGIMRAGGAYVPIDPSHPVDRIALMLDDARPTVLVVVDRSAALQYARDGMEIVEWQDIDPGRERADPAGGSSALSTSLAYVIFTSGSSGRPKGVHVDHAAVANIAQAAAQLYGITSGTRVLLFHSLSFDASVPEIFATLAVGGCVCVFDRSVPFDIDRLMTDLEQDAVQVAIFPPTVGNELRHEDLPALETLAVGGDVCPSALADRWLPRVSRFINVYGPTETTAFGTAAVNYRGTRRSPTWPIGSPIANVRAYVLDEHLQHCPVDVPGEVYMAGAGVARGYVLQPRLTADRFVPDPWGSPGSRMYRTGDRGRYRGDGVLEFLGRIDRQVKIRGVRIEPGEIEAVLRSHPAVKEVVVVPTESNTEKRLEAYVVPSGDERPTATVLREHARASLPEAMVPSSISWITELPRTVNGKTDFSALRPTPAAEVRESIAIDDVWRTTADIWRVVLGTETVRGNDDFFEIGGHSLAATRVVARARRELDLDVPVSTLFRFSVFAEFVAELRRAREQQGHTYR